jgi:hypothetical protein
VLPEQDSVGAVHDQAGAVCGGFVGWVGAVRRWCRYRSSTSAGPEERRFNGQDAVSVAAWTLTATWQFARFPTAPQYCWVTPSDAVPHLANDTSSADCGHQYLALSAGLDSLICQREPVRSSQRMRHSSIRTQVH